MITDFADEAMAGTFKHTLGRLPESDRAAIEKAVVLVTDNRERAVKHGGDVGADSSISPSGVVWLNTAALKPYGWRHVEAAIAHELAHAVLGHHRASKAAVGDVEGEYAADAKAVSWGYPSLVSYDSLHPQRVGGAPKPFGEVTF